MIFRKLFLKQPLRGRLRSMLRRLLASLVLFVSVAPALAVDAAPLRPHRPAHQPSSVTPNSPSSPILPRASPGSSTIRAIAPSSRPTRSNSSATRTIPRRGTAEKPCRTKASPFPAPAQRSRPTRSTPSKSAPGTQMTTPRHGAFASTSPPATSPAKKPGPAKAAG